MSGKFCVKNDDVLFFCQRQVGSTHHQCSTRSYPTEYFVPDINYRFHHDDSVPVSVPAQEKGHVEERGEESEELEGEHLDSKASLSSSKRVQLL